jgi:hypothetical protein
MWGKSVGFTSSFGPLSVAELRVFRSCVCFGFWGLEMFSVLPLLWAFENGLSLLLRVNRELAYFTPFAQ